MDQDGGDSPVLCWCNGTSQRDFRVAVAAEASQGFTEICAVTGVGKGCTACLVAAEVAFAEARQGGAAAGGGKAVAAAGSVPSFWRRPSLKAFSDWLEWIAPSRRLPTQAVMPVIAAPGTSTHLMVSGSYPAAIGPRCAPYRVEAEIRDQDGRLLGRERRRLDPGQRVAIELSAPLAAAAAKVSPGAPAFASAHIQLTPLADGYRGSTRPHFAIRTPGCTAVVHGTHTSAKGSRQPLMVRAGERYYVHARHVGGSGDALCRVTLAAEGAGAPAPRTVERRLPRDGFVVAVFDGADLAGPGGEARPALIDVAAACSVQSFLLIADPALRQISADHI